MNIVLIGYRGSGKTTWGRMLAGELWKTFVDVDVECCKRFGMDSIAAIWAQHGEPKWRQTEVAVTKELCVKDNQVIALGGGTLMQAGAKEAVQASHAVRIYLHCDAEELHRRIQADPRSGAARPNLTNLGGGVEEIRAVLREREAVYREVADKVFDVTHVKPDKSGLRHLIQRCL